MREAGDAAERMDECCIGKKVGFECISLVCWRSFCEEVDNMGDLPFWDIVTRIQFDFGGRTYLDAPLRSIEDFGKVLVRIEVENN